MYIVPLYFYSLKNIRSDTVAVADDRGRVHIWKLPLKITSQDPREMELFVEATSINTDM